MKSDNPYENHPAISREVDDEVSKWSNDELFDYVVNETWEKEADNYNTLEESDDAFRFFYRVGYTPHALKERLIECGFLKG